MGKPPQQKIIVILGPTSSGKSDLAVILAKKFKGEIISADSRQVYKEMNIGTGKITKKEMRGIPHHLLDVANPKRKYSVAQYKQEAQKIIRDVACRGKIPIICGGTGFYIQAIVDNTAFPKVKSNPTLRRELKKFSTEELFLKLKKLDNFRAKNIDSHNPHRLIRAIEIATELGLVPNLEARLPSKYDVLQLGIKTTDDVLKERIYKRLLARLRRGMVAEVKHLHTEGVSWKRMEELGLEYKFISWFLQEKISKEEMVKQLNTAIWQYAKRQKTWFKRDKRIKWFSLNEMSKMEKEVEEFLND